MTLDEQFRALRDAGRLDAAWCVAAVLVSQRRAAPDVLSFHAAHGRGLMKYTGTIPWTELAHPDELTALRAAAPIADRTPAAAGVRRSDRRVPATDPLVLSKLAVHVARVLDVPLAELYVIGDRGPALEAVRLRDGGTGIPALICRPNLLNGCTERDLVYRLAVELTRLKGEGLPRTARRVAAVISGDIGVALADPEADRDLVELWTSESHFALRQRCNISIAVDPGPAPERLASAPSRTEHVRPAAPRSLAEQFAEHKTARRFDEAWCIAHALVATGAASPEIEAYDETFAGRTQPSGVLPWRDLQHPDEDVTLSLQLAKSWPTRAAAHAQTLAQAKLSDKQRLHADRYLALFEMKSPPHYEVKKAPRPVQRAILTDGGEPYVALLVRVQSASEIPLSRFWGIEEVVLTRLPYRLCGFASDLPARWVNAVRATARRAALILTGDLKIALQATPPEAHADLVAFFTSDVYFQIRKDLSMTIAHRQMPATSQ